MDLIYIPFSFPGIPNVRCAFQTRVAAGKTPGRQPDSHAWGNVVHAPGEDPRRVDANRRTLQEQLGFAHWQECRQVHGDDMVFDPEPGNWDSRVERQADGLATRRRDQALVIKTADCQPLLLAHQSGDFVAALHVGWRGNRMGFPQSGVRALCAHYGVPPEEISAVRGPSLGPAASEFVNFDSEWGAEFAPYFNAQSRTMDLWRLTRDQLVEAGLKSECVFGLDLCTYSLNGYFFSYRRDKAGGRQASFIWIASDDSV